MHIAALKPATTKAQLVTSDPLASLSPSDATKFHKFGWGEDMAPRFSTIIDGFHHFARFQPETTAVTHQGAEISYGALNARATALANRLASRGLTQGDAVCLFLERSIDMVVGILATLKLGAYYVPQHLGVAPDEMLRHVAKATGSKVILTLNHLLDQLPSGLPQALGFPDETAPPSYDAPTCPEDLAMVLFTSGTTGTPNGVQVTHRNLCNILQTAPGDLGMRPGVRVGQILSISFDMAAWEILGALSNGATLVIRGKSIQDLAEQVDVIIATPSILNAVDTKRCQQVQVAAVAGEPCPRPLADKWAGFCAFFNSCGPTETTIINTAEQHLAERKTLSIGKPTPNNTVYILDDRLRPLPIGEKGEMWAGGDCVTAGYLGNPTLTAERYRPDPFRPGHMMFRTRDLGRWTDTGSLEHFGRVDDLVKIRGFRVELDGVSSALEATPCCDQAVTLKFNDRNLVSFISPASACPNAAHTSLRARLPYYSRPTLVLTLESLPRTPRGKIDKRLLLQIAAREIETRGVELT